jgi:hypothetical protein
METNSVAFTSFSLCIVREGVSMHNNKMVRPQKSPLQASAARNLIS